MVIPRYKGFCSRAYELGKGWLKIHYCGGQPWGTDWTPMMYIYIYIHTYMLERNGGFLQPFFQLFSILPYGSTWRYIYTYFYTHYYRAWLLKPEKKIQAINHVSHISCSPCLYQKNSIFFTVFPSFILGPEKPTDLLNSGWLIHTKSEIHWELWSI